MVNATFDGIPYRGQVVKMRTPCYIIGVTKQIRKQIGKSFGDMVEVVLHERDSEKSPMWKCPKCGREFKKKSKVITAVKSQRQLRQGRCRIDKKNCLVVLRNRKSCMRRNIMEEGDRPLS